MPPRRCQRSAGPPPVRPHLPSSAVLATASDPQRDGRTADRVSWSTGGPPEVGWRWPGGTRWQGATRELYRRSVAGPGLMFRRWWRADVRRAEFPAEPRPGRPPPHRPGRASVRRRHAILEYLPRITPGNRGRKLAPQSPLPRVLEPRRRPRLSSGSLAEGPMRRSSGRADTAGAAQAVDTIAVSTGRQKTGGRPRDRAHDTADWRPAPGAASAGRGRGRREPRSGVGSLTRRGQWSTVNQRSTGGPLAAPEGPCPGAAGRRRRADDALGERPQATHRVLADGGCR